MRAPLLLFAGLALAATAAAPAPPTGSWVETGPGTRFRFEPCGAAFCGVLEDSIYIKADADARDVKNPDPALRSRRLKGLTILQDLRPDAAGGWAGTIYISSMGQSFPLTLVRVNAATLQFTACLTPNDCHTATLTPA